MPYNNFNEIPLFTQIAVAIAGAWGAFINWIKRKKEGRPLHVKIGMFLVDLISTTGISILTFLALAGYGFNELFSVAVAGWMAHYGTRGFYLMEIVIAEKLNIKIDKDNFNEQK